MVRHELTDKGLLNEVLSVAPQASGVIVTGSLAADFGNEHSDIDLICIVPDGQFSQLPIMVYRGDAKIDCEYWLLPELLAAMDLINQSDFIQSVGNFLAWKKVTRALQFLIKFSVAYPLHVTDAIQPLSSYVRSTDFTLQVRAWWSLEALRLVIAARQSFSSQPRFSSNLYSEAAFAVLSSQATEQSLLFGKKWLGEKLRRLGDEAGLELYRLSLMLPCGDEAQVRQRCLEIDQALTRSRVLEPWLDRANQIRWWLTPGVRLHRFSDCVLLWQGKMGYEFPRSHAAESWRHDQVINAPRNAEWDEQTSVLLFKDGLIWPGLYFAESASESV